MKLRPLGEHIIVKLVEEEEKTKGGIVLPDTAKEKPQQGDVVAVGPGTWDEDHEKRIPLDIKVGDRVIFRTYAGTDWKIDGEKHLILKQDEVLAVVEREPATAGKK